MEILTYTLLALLSWVEIWVALFMVDETTLVPFSALALALAILMILIRLFYLKRGIASLEMSIGNIQGRG